MSESTTNILNFDELELYIKTLKPSKIQELGSIGWYAAHQRIQKVSQQLIFELKNVQEENVRDLLVSYSKMAVLVFEVVCVQVWCEKVFPQIMKICPADSQNNFMIYLIMFHEATVISILDGVLFHQDSCEALGDSVIDLVDYCALALAKLIGHKGLDEPNTKENTTTQQELEQQKNTLDFNIGTRCISIILSLASNLENLPLSVTSRMYSTHDLPIVLSVLREKTLWIKKDKKGNKLIFEDGTWQTLSGTTQEKVSRIEGQIWLALHQLLLNPRCSAHYDINEHRKNQLIKLQRFLTDPVIDQLSPLIDLKQWLTQVAISNLPSASRRPIILELVPEIRAMLLDRSEKKWKQLARAQAESLFNCDRDQLMSVAKSLCETYDLDVLETLEPTNRKCSGCGEQTTQRCSRCKTYYYCGRKCQVTNWKNHKPYCDKIAESMKNIDQ